VVCAEKTHFSCRFNFVFLFQPFFLYLFYERRNGCIERLVRRNGQEGIFFLDRRAIDRQTDYRQLELLGVNNAVFEYMFI
jgi:hypothetical protein